MLQMGFVKCQRKKISFLELTVHCTMYT